MIERAVVLAERETVELVDLPVEVQNFAAISSLSSGRGTASSVSPIPLADAGNPLFWSDEDPAAERRRLVEALHESQGNKTKAAQRLGLPRSTYFSKLKKFGITDNEPNEPTRYGRLPR